MAPAGGPPGAPPAGTRPNIVLLHCHDLGRFLGCYGVPTVRTPNIDTLARQGTRFDQMYCTAPQCSPSRASLFTGRYPQQHGVLGLTHLWFAFDLAPGEHHLGGILHDHGYRTELIGVHHESRARPADEIAAQLGFDRVVKGGLARVVAERAAARIHELSGQPEPFYLQVGFLEPHRLPGDRDAPGVQGFLGNHIEPDTQLGVTVPGYLRDDEGSRAEIAELQGSVRLMDSGVGQVLDALRASGTLDDTIVVFTTDHGLALPAAKCTLYDPGLEVAAIVRTPGRPSWSGRTTDALCSNIDVVPTLLDLAGLPQPAHLAGRSLVDAVEHGQPGRDAVFAQLTYHDYYDPRRCVRTARHKLVANFSAAPDVMDSSQSWRPRSTPLRLHKASPETHRPLELYDLEADPLEQHNLVVFDRGAMRPHPDDTIADVVARLQTDLLGWMREVDDPLLAGAATSPLHRNTLSLLAEATDRR